MAIIIKSVYWLVALICVILVLYCYSTFTRENKRLTGTIPRFYCTVNDIIDQVPPLKSIRDNLILDASLIYGVRSLGEIYATSICIAVVPLTALVFMTINIFCSTWYMSVIAFILAAVLPALSLKSSLTSKVIRVRKEVLRSQENIASTLAYNPVVLDAAHVVSRTSSGPVKKLYTKFCADYAVDRDEAYANYCNAVNDSYTKTFCDVLKRFEEQGVNPIEPLQRNAKMAARHYYIKGLGRRLFYGLKIMVLLYGASCIGFNVLGVYMKTVVSGVSVPEPLTSTPAFFVCLLLNLIALILCFVYENV